MNNSDFQFQNFYPDPHPERKTIRCVTHFELVEDPLFGWTKEAIMEWTREKMEQQRLKVAAFQRAKERSDKDYFDNIQIPQS